MAHQHSLFETFPCQRLRSGETAHTDEVSFLIYQGRFTVQYVGELVAGQRMHHLLQRVIFMEAVAGIEEAEIIARSQPDTLVHGVVQTFVRLAHYLCDVLLVPVCNRKRFIFGCSVDDDVLHVVIGL